MAKATEKVKTGSRTVVIAALGKAPNQPENPLPTKVTGAAVDVDEEWKPGKVVRSECAKAVSGKNAYKGRIADKN
jgi:hypothetical protein